MRCRKAIQVKHLPTCSTLTLKFGSIIAGRSLLNKERFSLSEGQERNKKCKKKKAKRKLHGSNYDFPPSCQ